MFGQTFDFGHLFKTHEIKTATDVVRDEFFVSAPSVHSDKFFTQRLAVAVCPKANVFDKTLASERGICHDAMQVNGWRGIVSPNERIVESDGKNGSDFVFDDDFPMAMLSDFGFNHRSVEALPAFMKNGFLKFDGGIVEFEDVFEVVERVFEKKHVAI